MNGTEQVKKERISTAAKKKAFLEALEKSLGVLAPAMKKAGIASRATIKTWRDTDKKFAAAMEEVKEVAGDFVETELYRKIQDGDTTAIIFYSKTKLRERGFAERTEITGKDGKDLFNNKTDEELDKEIEEMKRKLE